MKVQRPSGVYAVPSKQTMVHQPLRPNDPPDKWQGVPVDLEARTLMSASDSLDADSSFSKCSPGGCPRLSFCLHFDFVMRLCAAMLTPLANTANTTCCLADVADQLLTPWTSHAVHQALFCTHEVLASLLLLFLLQSALSRSLLVSSLLLGAPLEN